jgi:cytochrome c oxidase assembly factor CtaG
MPSIIRGIIATGVASVAVLSAMTPLEDFLGSRLILHIVAQHFVFIAAGCLFAYGIDSLILVASRLTKAVREGYNSYLKINFILNKRGITTFAAAAFFTAYWYIPANFDAALLTESVHIEMHLTFLAVGGLVYAGSKMLTKTMKQIAPVIISKAMGLYGTFLLLTPAYLYSGYPASEQAEAGVVMLVMMLLMDLTILPAWLYSYFGKTLPLASGS